MSQPPPPSGPSTLEEWWTEVHILWRFLTPTTFHFIAALLPAAIYIVSDQGAEILSMMGEALIFGPQFRPLAPLLFVAGSAAAGLTIWWSARIMLEFEWDPPVPPSMGGFAQVRAWLQKWWPRILGALPVLLVAVACFMRVSHYHNGGRTLGGTLAYATVTVLGVLHLVAAGFLWRYFLRRRRRLAVRSQPQFRSFAEMYRRLPESRRMQHSLLWLAVGTLAALWAAPQFVAPLLGTGAMLSLAVIAWVTIGTHLVVVRVRTKVPVFLVLIGWLIANSWWMDNHSVRLSRDAPPLAKGISVAQAYSEWRERQPAAAEGKLRPLFLVATEGGGIRAAYWTATVLATLQEQSLKADPGAVRHQPFAESCLAISGVSGGSVGAAVFDALLADGRAKLVEEAQDILGRDHLAPLMGSLLFPDAVQRAIPWALPGTDRGAVLERSWERAYRHATGTRRLAEPFHGLWAPGADGRPPAIPHLLLNATAVNTGQRVIFSDLEISAPEAEREFFDAVDMREVLYRKTGGVVQSADIPLSSAAHCSARFTYTNPAGLLSSGERVVDGGYFENSGAASLREALAALRDHRADMARDGVQPVVIIISNDPQTLPEGTRAKWLEPAQAELQTQLAGAPAPAPLTPMETQDSAGFQATKPHQICSELLSPPRALMHTREARGTLALRTLYHELGAAPDDAHPNIIRFQLIANGIPLPLGWSLSQQAAQDMQGQAWAGGNAESIQQILKWLELP